MNNKNIDKDNVCSNIIENNNNIVLKTFKEFSEKIDSLEITIKDIKNIISKQINKKEVEDLETFINNLKLYNKDIQDIFNIFIRNILI